MAAKVLQRLFAELLQCVDGLLDRGRGLDEGRHIDRIARCLAS